MTDPSQHLPEEILTEYVSGRASEADSLTVACHATLCGRCQGRIDGLEAIAGAALETAPGLSLDDGVLDKVMASLDDDDPPVAPTPPPIESPVAAALRLPRPLLRYLERAGGLKWKFRLPGVHVITLPLVATTTEVVARLVRFKAGLTVPLHGHAGPEYTVTFTGAFEDAGVRYGRGDVRVRDTGERHTQRILPGDDCVVLAVNKGPLVPLTWAGRLMRFFGDRRSD